MAAKARRAEPADVPIAEACEMEEAAAAGAFDMRLNTAAAAAAGAHGEARTKSVIVRIKHRGAGLERQPRCHLKTGTEPPGGEIRGHVVSVPP
eukprot:5925735-Prymnesium_polylepis.1